MVSIVGLQYSHKGRRFPDLLWARSSGVARLTLSLEFSASKRENKGLQC